MSRSLEILHLWAQWRIIAILSEMPTTSDLVKLSVIASPWQGNGAAPIEPKGDTMPMRMGIYKELASRPFNDLIFLTSPVHFILSKVPDHSFSFWVDFID